MTDLQLALLDVLHDPSDDAPRLRMADVLDDHGQSERAEFIRVQIAIAKGFDQNSVPLLQRHRDGAACGCRMCKLHIRERELLYNFNRWREWVKPIEHLWGNEQRNLPAVAFVRGFISQLTLSWADCERHLSAICESHPVLAVELTDKRPWRALQVNEKFRYGYEIADDNAQDAWQICPEIFRHLGRGDYWINDHYRWWWSEAAARDALSAACLNYAKNKSKSQPELA
jgi:uncharacterized protein (TIGR02996 family)